MFQFMVMCVDARAPPVCLCVRGRMCACRGKGATLGVSPQVPSAFCLRRGEFGHIGQASWPISNSHLTRDKIISGNQRSGLSAWVLVIKSRPLCFFSPTLPSLVLAVQFRTESLYQGDYLTAYNLTVCSLVVIDLLL